MKPPVGAEVRQFFVISPERPWRRPYLVTAVVRFTKESVWIDLPYRSFRYGSTAFGTFDAAQRECFFRIREYVLKPYNMIFNKSIIDRCNELLAKKEFP